MKCPDCHQEHPEGTLFCPLTGRKISLPVHLASLTHKNKYGSASISWLFISLGGICSLLILAAAVFVAFWNSASQAGSLPAGIVLPAPASTASGKIAFVSDRDENSEIYVMDADGSHPTRLTKSLAQTKNDFPAWSPDGQKIAYVSNRDGSSEIYIMNADGSHQARLTDHQKSAFSPGAGTFHPAWSPDGLKLAFISGMEGENKICLVNADGSSLTCLAETQVGGYYSSSPLDQQIISLGYDEMGVSWSADGQKLVYSSKRSGNSKIYLMNADGSAQTYLTNDRGDFSPDWSADGQKIAFVSTRDGNFQIYVTNADGSAPIALTHEKEMDSFSPCWSADGQRIAFVSNRAGNYAIYIMNADGSHPTRLTDDQSQNWNPAWSQ